MHERPEKPESSASARPSAAAAEGRDGDTDELAARDAADGAHHPAAPTFTVVGIGASAGGLEALEALTRRLTSDRVAFVVIQHLAPDHESALAEILARCTPMKVVTIKDGLVLEPSVIYVTPPNVNIELSGTMLRVKSPADRLPRNSIDIFFRSLAREVGQGAIGVVLSGAGSDGTLGLRAIKDEGGITFAQEPTTAVQQSMPQSALEAGAADFALSPAEIGDELMRLLAHPFVARKRPARLFDEESLRRIFDRLRATFGIDFGSYKPSTIERRIERRMALQRIDRIEDYAKFVESNAGELSILYSDLLIGVSAFFRDRAPFDALTDVVFPRLFEKRSPALPIRMWVPGCARGEEAYSVAICLLEYLGENVRQKIQIFATDIDDAALHRARAGIYPREIENDVNAERLQRYFSKVDKGYQVARSVRDLIVFARHNLGKDAPFSRLDLVTCRNVLIYMQPSLQRQVLRVFHYALNPDAFLVLGTSESVGDASDLFSLVDRRLKIYVKKNIPSSVVFDFSAANRTPDPVAAAKAPADLRPMVSIQHLADRKIIEKYGPPGVLLNETLEVIQFRGQTAPFLAPAPGAATFSIFKLARPELLTELRATLEKVSEGGLAASSEPIFLLDEPESCVVLDVMPLHDASARRKCALVSFRTVVPASDAAPASGPAPAARHAEKGVADLERQLLVAKEYLETMVRELEAANEELQSSNEELQSSNEELQSTNEELETSKEELQSTNEELSTVNEELRTRMAQLATSNDDLQNIMASTSAAIVFVGVDLRMRRFTAAAERLLSLVEADVGRPVGYLGGVIKAPQLEATVAETMHSTVPHEQRVRSVQGSSYMLRTWPYRTAEQAVRGALVELSRAPPISAVGEQPEIPDLVGRVLSTLPHTLLLLDEQFRIVWANKSFFDMFQVGAEVLGLPLDRVCAGREPPSEFWTKLEETVSDGSPFRDALLERPFGRSGERPMRFSSSRINSDADRATLTVVVLEEIRGFIGGSS